MAALLNAETKEMSWDCCFAKRMCCANINRNLVNTYGKSAFDVSTVRRSVS